MIELIVPRRFCGPPSSGNGGWTAGALAGLVGHATPENRVDSWPAIEVALRQPPPLDTPMQVTDVDGVTTATFGGTTIATARAVLDDSTGGTRTLEEVPPVSYAEAWAAESGYPGLTSHPFPTCFVCGTGREPGDGLRIFPGRVADVDDRQRVAATWTPDGSLTEDWHTYVDEVARVSLASTWAALDCIGGWAGDLTERLMVLARMTARVDTLPVVGEQHVLVGARHGQEGRKTFTASTLLDSDGRVVATAEHLWVAIDPGAFS